MQSLIRSSTKIHKAITDRIEELDLSYGDIVKDAKELNYKIFPAQLSRYLNKEDGYGLTEEQILFLCFLYGVGITLSVEVLKYDKEKCVERAKLFIKNK